MLLQTILPYARLRLPAASPVRACAFLFDESCAEERELFQGYLHRELSAMKMHLLVAGTDPKEVTELLKELRQRQAEKEMEADLPVVFHICARVHKKNSPAAALLKGAGTVQYICFSEDTSPPAHHRRSTLCLPSGEGSVMALVYFTYLRLISDTAPAAAGGQLGFFLCAPARERALATIAARTHACMRPVSRMDAMTSMRSCVGRGEAALAEYLKEAPAWPGLSAFPMQAGGLKPAARRKPRRTLGEALRLLFGSQADAEHFCESCLDWASLEGLFRRCWDDVFAGIPLEVLSQWLPLFLGSKKNEAEAVREERKQALAAALESPFVMKGAKPWHAARALLDYDTLLRQYREAKLSAAFWSYAAQDLAKGRLNAQLHETRTALEQLHGLLLELWVTRPRSIVLQDAFFAKRCSSLRECIACEPPLTAAPKAYPGAEDLLTLAAAAFDEPAAALRFALGAPGTEPVCSTGKLLFACVPGLPPEFIAVFAAAPFAKGGA